MACLNKKGDEGSPIGLIIAAIIGIVILASVIAFYSPIKDMIKENTVERSVCMFTNTINNGGGLFSAIPSLCNTEYIEQPVDMAGFSNLIRDTWWMYLQGKGDIGLAGDEVHLTFSFTPAEDIKLIDYFGYSMNHTRTKYTDDITKSDYAYFETNTLGNTICFDKSNEKSSINNLYLEKGETYYIFFYDDLSPHEMNDMILISTDSDFNADYWKAILLDYWTYMGPPGKIASTVSSLTGHESLSFYIANYVKDSSCVDYGLGNPNE